MNNNEYSGRLVIAIAIILVIVSGIAIYNTVYQPNKTTTTHVEKKQKKSNEKSADTKKTHESTTKKSSAKKHHATHYHYTAERGDSYTLIARRAISRYAKSSHTDVSRAQIVAAETYLTNDAGSPYLDRGQNVTLSIKSVAKAVKKARGLSASELRAWATYVPYINWSDE